MSRYTAEKLYDLLPAIYRIRDSEQGKPLKALLTVVAEQMALLEEDIGDRTTTGLSRPARNGSLRTWAICWESAIFILSAEAPSASAHR